MVNRARLRNWFGSTVLCKNCKLVVFPQYKAINPTNLGKGVHRGPNPNPLAYIGFLHCAIGVKLGPQGATFEDKEREGTIVGKNKKRTNAYFIKPLLPFSPYYPLRGFFHTDPKIMEKCHI